MNRRAFLLSLAAAPFLAHCGDKRRTFSGQLLGANAQAGHQLRTGIFPAFSQTKRTKIAIIGAGISGLSAGWYLQKKGVDDFTLFELEAQIGGNARSGQNQVSAYPWGAHYLPIPNQEAHLLKQFLNECGAITAGADSAKPTYNERYLCFAPDERLYINGLWQEGLVPHNGIPKTEQLELEQFEQKMQAFRSAVGKDGKPAFAIPLADSSADAEFTALDKISMQDYLHQQGWHGKALHWYVNYACRDDYGVHAAHISAWAGIHYFAARRGAAANAESEQVLTWPQGNAWLVDALARTQKTNIITHALVHAIGLERHHVAIDVLNLQTQQTTRWLADEVIYASPLHTLPYVLRNPSPTKAREALPLPLE